MRAASRHLAFRYYQKCQEAQSLKGELENLRDALLIDIRKLKAQINKERDANQSLTLESKALLRRHHQLRAQASKSREERAR